MRNPFTTRQQASRNEQAIADATTNNALLLREQILIRRLVRSEESLAKMQDAFLRARAEIENTRRRTQEEIARAHKFAIEDFAESLVPVKDCLELAIHIDTPSIESLKEGVEMTLKQLAAAFEKHRLVEINPARGDLLDPARHQALSIVPAARKPNTIVHVLQKGYMISDRLLRPALVTVAQGPDAA